MSQVAAPLGSRLADFVGAGRVLSDSAALDAYEIDGRRPFAALLPGTVAEIAEILRHPQKPAPLTIMADPNAESTSLLIVDDYATLRRRLKEILMRELPGAVCGEAQDAQQVLAQVRAATGTS